MQFKFKKDGSGLVLKLNESDSILTSYNPSFNIKYEYGRTLIVHGTDTIEDFLKSDLSYIIEKDGTINDVSTLTIDEYLNLLSCCLFDNSNDIFIQDQTTTPLIAKFNMFEDSTTLSSDASINDLSINVIDPTKISIGNYITIFSPTTNRVYFATALSETTNPIILDTPFDSNFLTGSFVDISTPDFNIDGSTTSKTFGIRGSGTESTITSIVDITEITLSCQTSSPIDLDKFGDLTSLTRGLILRKKDGTYFNIFNAKNNDDLSKLFNFQPLEALNPAQGRNGFIAVLKFGGQQNIGVVVRLKPGEDLEFIIQDDLQLLVSLTGIVKGHFVE